MVYLKVFDLHKLGTHQSYRSVNYTSRDIRQNITFIIYAPFLSKNYIEIDSVSVLTFTADVGGLFMNDLNSLCQNYVLM